MMISLEGNFSREIVKTVVICFILILVPAVIMISYTIVNFNTNQPGRAQEVPTPTNPPWIIIMTATSVPSAVPTVSACNDSDGGVDYYQTGIIKSSGTGCNTEGLTDSCFATSFVKEYYCGPQDECLTVYYKCLNGCSNGSCLTSPVTSTPAITTVEIPTISPTVSVSSAIPPLVSPTNPIGSPALTTGVCPRRSQGDADCNGVIDLIDFEIWRENFIGGFFTLASDFDPDGKVDLIDFEIWRSNFLLQSIP